MCEPPDPHPPLAGQLGDLVAAKLRRVEVAMLARILATTLAGALPPSRVQVQRRRSPADVVRRRPGVVVGVSVSGEDRVLTLRAIDVEQIRAESAHVVRGVTLSHNTIGIAAWLDELASMLNRDAADDEATRRALHRALLT